MIQQFCSYIYTGKTYVHTKTWIQIFLTSLLTIAKNTKQPEYPPVAKEIQGKQPQCTIQWNTTQQ